MAVLENISEIAKILLETYEFNKETWKAAI